MEYSRRLRPGAKLLAPSLTRVNPHEFESQRFLDHEWEGVLNSLSDYSPSGIDRHQYGFFSTSNHGIMMMADVPREWQEGRAGEISLPHVSIIYNHYYSRDEKRLESRAFIKYEDHKKDYPLLFQARPPSDPKVHRFKNKSFLGHVVQGNCVFLFLKAKGTEVFYINTLTKQTALCHYHGNVRPLYSGGRLSTLPIVFHDGLFHEFFKGEYTATQVSITPHNLVNQKIEDVGNMYRSSTSLARRFLDFRSLEVLDKSTLDSHLYQYRYISFESDMGNGTYRTIVNLATGCWTVGHGPKKNRHKEISLVTTAKFMSLLQKQGKMEAFIRARTKDSAEPVTTEPQVPISNLLLNRIQLDMSRIKDGMLRRADVRGLLRSYLS